MSLLVFDYKSKTIPDQKKCKYTKAKKLIKCIVVDKKMYTKCC